MGKRPDIMEGFVASIVLEAVGDFDALRSKTDFDPSFHARRILDLCPHLLAEKAKPKRDIIRVRTTGE